MYSHTHRAGPSLVIQAVPVEIYSDESPERRYLKSSLLTHFVLPKENWKIEDGLNNMKDVVRMLLNQDTGHSTRLRVPDSNVTALQTHTAMSLPCRHIFIGASMRKPASVRQQPGGAALDEGLLPTQQQSLALRDASTLPQSCC